MGRNGATWSIWVVHIAAGGAASRWAVRCNVPAGSVSPRMTVRQGPAKVPSGVGQSLCRRQTDRGSDCQARSRAALDRREAGPTRRPAMGVAIGRQLDRVAIQKLAVLYISIDPDFLALYLCENCFQKCGRKWLLSDMRGSQHATQTLLARSPS